VDGIVADLHGVMPLFGTSIVSLLDARDRLLKPGGWMIPSRESLWVAAIACPARHAALVEPWDTEYGFDFSSARTKTVNRWSQAAVKAEELVVDPQCWATLDYDSLRGTNVSGEASWTVARSAVAHGLSLWFDSETAPGIGFSNSPLSGERHIYKQGFFPWPRATELQAGDIVHVRLRADFVSSDYVWTWTTRVTDGVSGSIKASYDQSTFLATPMSLDRRRKRADTFVPVATEDARIDRRILELMAESLTVGEMARRIQSEFPSRFKDRNAALARVGDLSERYSTSG
jgi:type I protein arginine methyltransferase